MLRPTLWGLLNALAPSAPPPDIPLIGVQCHCLLVNNLAEVTIKQRYRNTSSNPIQAIYVFPVDDEAAVNGFTAHLGQRLVRGVIEERKEARANYDAALTQGHGAALLETAGAGALKVQLGNLEAGCEAEICIVYSSLCSVEENAIVLRVPTTIKERYMPASEWQRLEAAAQPTYRSGVRYGLSLDVDVYMPGDVVSVSSSTHPLSVRNDPVDRHHCSAKLGVEKVAMDGDVIIRVEHASLHKPAVVLASQADVDQGSAAMMLTFIPEFDEATGVPPENMEFVFLVDRSGSMKWSNGGNSRPIDQCRDALQLFLRSLPEGCTFNIVGFGNRYTKLFPESRVYDSGSLAEATQHVAQLDADMGGTEILTPIRDILTAPEVGVGAGGWLKNKLTGQSEPASQRHRKLFLLTDGAVGNTAEVIRTVKQNAQTTRVFTFGVGDGAAADLVRGVARAGRGEGCFIRHGEPIDEKVIGQLEKAMEPVLEGVEIDWGILSVKEQSPSKDDLAPVFNNTPYTVFALLSKESQHQGQVTLRGQMNGKPAVFAIDVTPWTTSRTDCRILHSLSAKHVIRDLEEKDGGGGGSKAAILALALRYEVASSQTSFLAIEEREEAKGGAMTTVQVPLCPIQPLSAGRPVMLSQSYGMRGTGSAGMMQPMSISCGGGGRGGGGGAKMGGRLKLASTSRSAMSLGSCAGPPPPPVPSARMRCSFSAGPPPPPGGGPTPPTSGGPPPPPDDGPVPWKMERQMKKRSSNTSSMRPQQEQQKQVQQSSSTDPLQAVASLQAVNGSWQLDDRLASAVQLPKDAIISAQPSSISATAASSLWATAVALACLLVKCSGKQAAFSLMEKKAKKWMASQIGSSSPSVAELIASAKALF